MNRAATVVAVINTNPEIVSLFKTEIERSGFVVVTAHVDEIKSGRIDVKAFLAQHDPKVIMYDVAPPYDRNWRFMDHLRLDTDFKGRHFVLTTVNKDRLHEAVGTDESVYEIVGEAQDVEAVVRAVKEAARARPVRRKGPSRQR